MILLLAIIAGFILGLARTWINHRSYKPAPLVHTWLVIVSMLPQVVVFYCIPLAKIIPGHLIPYILVISNIGLLIFIVLNLDLPGFKILCIGLIFNLSVIVANHGLMPISPEIASQLFPNTPSDLWQTGVRFGWSKDIVLERSNTYLWWLSDRFRLPEWFFWRGAFSMGDVFISFGAFWLLWEGGGWLEKYPGDKDKFLQPISSKEMNNELHSICFTNSVLKTHADANSPESYGNEPLDKCSFSGS
jgi:hypothetical protein